MPGTINGVDIFTPNAGEIYSENADSIACWPAGTDITNKAPFPRPEGDRIVVRVAADFDDDVMRIFRS